MTRTLTICSVCKLSLRDCLGHIGIRKGCRQAVTVEMDGDRIVRITQVTEAIGAGGSGAAGLVAS